MYNNVGIRTPRGSGTSGHVMSNRSHVRAQAFRMGIDRNTGKLQARDWEEPPPRKANEELLDHQRKRKVEAKIFELQEAMADRGYSDAEIEEKVAEVRKGLEEREESGQKASLLKGKKGAGGAGAGAMDSHMRDVKKADDNRRMREAFGLGDDYAAGEAFDEEAQERKKEARRKEREAKDKEWEEKKAAKKAEEKKEKRRREKTGSDDDQDDQEGGARKGSSRRSDSQEAERNSMMAKRAERFGASADEPRGPSNNDRKGRGQFRAGGAGNKNNDRRGGGRDGRDGDGRRPSEMNVKDALAGGLSARRGGSRRDRGRSEDEGPRDVVIHVDGEDGGGRGRPRDRAEGSGRNVHVRVAGEGGREDSEDSRYRGDRRGGRRDDDDDDSDREGAEREVIVVTQSGVDENDRWQADGNGVFADDGLGGGSAAPAAASTTTPADDDLRGRIKGRGRRGAESESPPRKKAALAPPGRDLRERISGGGRRGGGGESPPKKQRRKRSPSSSGSNSDGTGGAGSPARPAKRAPAAEGGSDKRKRDGSRDSGGRGADKSRGGVGRSDKGRGGGDRNGGGGGKGGRRRSRSEESSSSGPPAGGNAIS
ncbi:unnamed protein product [Ectocarpus fasciculatus]